MHGSVSQSVPEYKVVSQLWSVTLSMLHNRLCLRLITDYLAHSRPLWVCLIGSSTWTPANDLKCHTPNYTLHGCASNASDDPWDLLLDWQRNESVKLWVHLNRGIMLVKMVWTHVGFWYLFISDWLSSQCGFILMGYVTHCITGWVLWRTCIVISLINRTTII